MQPFTYESIDGVLFGGVSEKDVVLQMARHDYIADGKQDYMEKVAVRLREFGVNITAATGDEGIYKDFLDQLEQHRIIRRL